MSKNYRVPRPHGEKVCHHGAESRSKTGLGDKSEFELGEADHVVPLLPVPAGDVQQVGLVVVLHQLDDHADVVAVVLDRDHPHDVGSVFCVRVLAVLIGQQQTRVRLTNLRNARRAKKYSFENDLTFARSRSPGFINEP